MSSRTFLESKEIFKVGDKITWGKYILEDGKPFDCQKDWPDMKPPFTIAKIVNNDNPTKRHPQLIRLKEQMPTHSFNGIWFTIWFTKVRKRAKPKSIYRRIVL